MFINWIIDNIVFPGFMGAVFLLGIISIVYIIIEEEEDA